MCRKLAAPYTMVLTALAPLTVPRDILAWGHAACPTHPKVVFGCFILFMASTVKYKNYL